MVSRDEDEEMVVPVMVVVKKRSNEMKFLTNVWEYVLPASAAARNAS